MDKLNTIKKKKYLLKVYNDKGGMRKYTSKDSSRRISSIISRVNFKKAYIKVSYGKAICNYGCLCEFYNDGWYFSKEDLKQALDSFRKEEL